MYLEFAIETEKDKLRLRCKSYSTNAKYTKNNARKEKYK